MTHPDEAALLRYIAEYASEEEQLEIDSHLADCDDCLSRVRGLRYLRENFDSVLASWNPRGYRRLLEPEQGQDTTATAPDSPEEPPPHAKGLTVRIRCAIDAIRGLAQTAVDAIPSGFAFGPQAALAGVGAPDEGKVDFQSRGCVVNDILHEGKVVAQVIVDGLKQCILIKYWPQRSEQTFFSATLASMKEGQERITVPFTEVEGTDYLLAEFVDLVDGTYTVVLTQPPTKP